MDWDQEDFDINIRVSNSINNYEINHIQDEFEEEY